MVKRSEHAGRTIEWYTEVVVMVALEGRNWRPLRWLPSTFISFAQGSVILYDYFTPGILLADQPSCSCGLPAASDCLRLPADHKRVSTAY
jgi:hypothetical protein